ncbi:Glycosyltransferase, GT2 family [Pricia antarctica]|uniref:Glycosyltransferase, GT2 family n=1 Tax=Pricia antarctica TaxID=641691 RepID=A0A1G7I6K2_9FLAO|nr:glycosyltransferase [Pricia antarctica]SDF08186.1 Glycosyltransferase, GT2 family [Pricia antarctica]
MNPYSVIITHYEREGNLKNTLKGLNRQSVLPTEVIVIEMGQGLHLENNFEFPLKIVNFERFWEFMPLAAARNLGAEHSSTEHLVFLDVDCIPSDNFCQKIVAASASRNALAMGSPRYILHNNPMGFCVKELRENSIFHPSRPEVNGIVKEECYELFWSLCFSLSRELFERIGGFDDRFEGYGAEDTDFALEVKKAGIPFYLTDAEVYHQQHPIYVPPLNHLEPIIKNSNLFFAKWGYWPMVDCLQDFSDMGYIQWQGNKDTPITLKRKPTTQDIRERLIKNAPYR